VERRKLMDTNPTSFALGPGDGEAFRASAEQTGGRVSVIEEVSLRGAATPLHVHREDDETFYVLEGEITFYLEDDPLRRRPARSCTFLGGRPTPSG
jgi:quercetin dioxygenase-like cupin family protein